MARLARQWIKERGMAYIYALSPRSGRTPLLPLGHQHGGRTATDIRHRVLPLKQKIITPEF